EVDSIRTLMACVVTDCCDGHPELCHFQGTLWGGTCVPLRPPRGRIRRKKYGQGPFNVLFLCSGNFRLSSGPRCRDGRTGNLMGCWRVTKLSRFDLLRPCDLLQPWS